MKIPPWVYWPIIWLIAFVIGWSMPDLGFNTVPTLVLAGLSGGVIGVVGILCSGFFCE